MCCRPQRYLRKGDSSSAAKCRTHEKANCRSLVVCPYVFNAGKLPRDDILSLCRKLGQRIRGTNAVSTFTKRRWGSRTHAFGGARQKRKEGFFDSAAARTKTVRRKGAPLRSE